MTLQTKLTLVHDSTGRPVEIGELLTDFRGDTAYLTGIETPRHAGSTGRVRVQVGTWSREYFPGVYNLTWVELATFERRERISREMDASGARFEPAVPGNE